MRAAAGALRDELVALQAVDAAEPAGQLGRPQPRLAAARAGRPREGAGAGFTGDRSDSTALTPPRSARNLAMKKPSVRSRSLRVCRKGEPSAAASVARPGSAARSSAPGRSRRRRPRSRTSRSCRSSRRSARRGRRPPPPGRGCGRRARPSARSRSGLRRQRESGLDASVPSPEQGGSTRTASKRRLARPAADPPRPRSRRRPPALRGSSASPRAPGRGRGRARPRRGPRRPTRGQRRSARP